jgi:DNA polymerase V
LGNRLEQFQIRTACDLKYLDPVQARKTGGIVLEKTVNELNGIRGLNILNLPKPRKQLRSSRQFGIPVFKLEDLKEGLLLYATQVVNRLRKENFETSSIVVELSTGTLNAQNLIYANAYRTKLDDPTDNLLVIYKTAEKGLENIYRPGYKYKRVGIWLEELSPKDSRQLSLFSGSSPSSPLDASVEKIKAKLANVTIGLGTTGLSKKRPWYMQQKTLSPPYTTSLGAIPLAKA